MTFETYCHFTEESISQCKELINFLKRKNQIEADYAKQLGEARLLILFYLGMSILMAFWHQPNYAIRRCRQSTLPGAGDHRGWAEHLGQKKPVLIETLS
jgi:hypothetical protein